MAKPKREKKREKPEGGTSDNVRVKRVGSEVTMIRVWGAHERIAVRRTGGE